MDWSEGLLDSRWKSEQAVAEINRLSNFYIKNRFWRKALF